MPPLITSVVIDTYPGSTIAETAKAEEASVRGLKNEDENPAKAGDNKDGEKKAEDPKPADAPATPAAPEAQK